MMAVNLNNLSRHHWLPCQIVFYHPSIPYPEVVSCVPPHVDAVLDNDGAFYWMVLLLHVRTQLDLCQWGSVVSHPRQLAAGAFHMSVWYDRIIITGKLILFMGGLSSWLLCQACQDAYITSQNFKSWEHFNLKNNTVQNIASAVQVCAWFTVHRSMPPSSRGLHFFLGIEPQHTLFFVSVQVYLNKLECCGKVNLFQ